MNERPPWMSELEAYKEALHTSVSKQIGGLREMADLGEMNDYAAGEMHAYTYVLRLIDGRSDE